MAARLLASLALGALLQHANAWQGAAGPNYYTGDVTLDLHSLTAPTAVCNDGSPAGYYYSAGTNSQLWVVYLEGGYWCVDQASCEGRQANEPQEMSSASWPSSVQAGGIFSRDATQNPGFAGANQVYIGYCSSDAWMGDTEQWGFQFRGQSILAATLAQLQSNYGLGAGHQVLLAGCSAGARGVLVNLDNVAAALPGVEVRGLLDSGLWVDAQPSDPSTTESLMEETQQVYAWANAGALIPADCAAMYSGTPWYCLFGQYRIHFVQTPYFASESQFDSFLLTYNLGGETPRYGFQVTYADTLQQDVSAMMSALPAAGQSDSGVFSSTCLLHCTTNGPDYYTVKVGTQSLASAVQAWFFQDAGRQQIISGCQGWSCNSQCKGEEEPALQGGANGNGGGGLRGPPGPLHPGQYQLDPNSSEPWQEQLAQARKAAAAQAPQQQG